MKVVREQQLRTVRLDDVPEAHGADYLKLDAQGGELDILRHGTDVLRSVLIVHTEVEFVPLYEKQPLFADVDAELRRNGFMFHKFDGTAGRPYKPLRMKDSINIPISQCLWADAIYVRDVTKLDSLSTGSLLKLAAMLDILYQSFDLSASILQLFDKRSGFSLQRTYLDYLMSVHGDVLTFDHS